MTGKIVEEIIEAGTEVGTETERVPGLTTMMERIHASVLAHAKEGYDVVVTVSRTQKPASPQLETRFTWDKDIGCCCIA